MKRIIILLLLCSFVFAQETINFNNQNIELDGNYNSETGVFDGKLTKAVEELKVGDNTYKNIPSGSDVSWDGSKFKVKYNDKTIEIPKGVDVDFGEGKTITFNTENQKVLYDGATYTGDIAITNNKISIKKGGKVISKFGIMTFEDGGELQLRPTGYDVKGDIKIKDSGKNLELSGHTYDKNSDVYIFPKGNFAKYYDSINKIYLKSEDNGFYVSKRNPLKESGVVIKEGDTNSIEFFGNDKIKLTFKEPINNPPIPNKNSVIFENGKLQHNPTSPIYTTPTKDTDIKYGEKKITISDKKTPTTVNKNMRYREFVPSTSIVSNKISTEASKFKINKYKIVPNWVKNAKNSDVATSLSQLFNIGQTNEQIKKITESIKEKIPIIEPPDTDEYTKNILEMRIRVAQNNVDSSNGQDKIVAQEKLNQEIKSAKETFGFTYQGKDDALIPSVKNTFFFNVVDNTRQKKTENSFKFLTPTYMDKAKEMQDTLTQASKALILPDKYTLSTETANSIREIKPYMGTSDQSVMWMAAMEKSPADPSYDLYNTAYSVMLGLELNTLQQDGIKDILNYEPDNSNSEINNMAKIFQAIPKEVLSHPENNEYSILNVGETAKRLGYTVEEIAPFNIQKMVGTGLMIEQQKLLKKDGISVTNFGIVNVLSQDKDDQTPKALRAKVWGTDKEIAYVIDPNTNQAKLQTVNTKLNYAGAPLLSINPDLVTKSKDPRVQEAELSALVGLLLNPDQTLFAPKTPEEFTNLKKMFADPEKNLGVNYDIDNVPGLFWTKDKIAEAMKKQSNEALEKALIDNDNDVEQTIAELIKANPRVPNYETSLRAYYSQILNSE